jgi:hypothetical protein
VVDVMERRRATVAANLAVREVFLALERRSER